MFAINFVMLVFYVRGLKSDMRIVLLKTKVMFIYNIMICLNALFYLNNSMLVYIN